MKQTLVILALVVLACSAVSANPATSWGLDNTTWSKAGPGAYTASGYVYNPNGGQGIWDKGSEVGTGAFTVTADVEMWMNMAFYANSIYFHIGSYLAPGTKISQSVGGYLQSNSGQYIFVTKPDPQPEAPDISTLNLKHDVLGRVGNPSDCPAIPVKWFLKDSAPEEREGLYSKGGNGGLLWGQCWLLDSGNAGMHNFTIRCEISPNEYQPDGYYEMDPILASSPEI